MMKRAGTSTAIFAALAFASGIVTAPFLDGFTIDLLALALIFVGLSVRSGSRRAAKWAIGISVLYALVAVALSAVAIVNIERIRIGGYTARSPHLPWILLCMTVVFVWCVLNLVLLSRSLRKVRTGAEPPARSAPELRAEGASSEAPQP